MGKWLLYGANGYTGTLMAEYAVEKGLKPVLSGRSEAKIRPLAERLELDWVIIDLQDKQKLTTVVSEFDLVMHAAGPFVKTAHPMIKACIVGNTHYLDITGEIDVFEYAFSHFQDAVRAEIAIMPGVGFDVIPTDCMAAYVSNKLPDATHLEIAFNTMGGMSPGTSKTMIESIDMRNGLARRNGVLQTLPTRIQSKTVQFSHKKMSTMPIPWGDLVTAFHTTGIPNITTYFAMPESQIKQMERFGWMMGVLKFPPLKRLALNYVDKNITGPDFESRENGRAYVYAQAKNKKGETAEAWLETMEAYKLTALGGLRCVERVIASDLKGVYTPAGAFGPDLVMELPGSTRYDECPV